MGQHWETRNKALFFLFGPTQDRRCAASAE